MVNYLSISIFFIYSVSKKKKKKLVIFFWSKARKNKVEYILYYLISYLIYLTMTELRKNLQIMI